MITYSDFLFVLEESAALTPNGLIEQLDISQIDLGNIIDVATDGGTGEIDYVKVISLSISGKTLQFHFTNGRLSRVYLIPIREVIFKNVSQGNS